MIGVAAALAAAQAPPPPPPQVGNYQCEVRGGEDGSIDLTSRFHADGNEALTFGSWTSLNSAGQPQLSIHWQFVLNEQRPYKAYAQVSIPLRRKLSGTWLLNLTRPHSATVGLMALASPVRLAGGDRNATVAVDLDTLLDYAGEEQDLSWQLVRPEPFRGSVDSGPLGLSRLKVAVKRFGPLLDQLNAMRADFRNRCTYSPEPLAFEE